MLMSSPEKGSSMDRNIVRGAIVAKFGSQCVAAKVLGIHERRLSRLLNGHDQLKPREVKILQEQLGVGEDE
jgi:plasmid maintenance system antidote protein VapI